MPIENEEEEVIGVVEDDFKVPKKRGFRSKKRIRRRKKMNMREKPPSAIILRKLDVITDSQESSPTMGFQSAPFAIQRSAKSYSDMAIEPRVVVEEKWMDVMISME